MRTITIVGKGHWGKAPLTKNGTRALLNQGTGSGDPRLDQGTTRLNGGSLLMNEGMAGGD